MLQRGRLNAVLLILLSVPALPAELVAPYVNTVHEDVALMLDMAEVGPGDYLIDLGSGDGRIVIAAALRGARGHGVELQPELVELARKNAAAAGVADRIHFIEGDIFEADLSAATVVTLYLFPEANLQLRPKLQRELAPGTRLVSNAFHMGDWQPLKHEYGRTSGGAMLWVIPSPAPD
jgi:precorrin-6B methylase 2